LPREQLNDDRRPRQAPASLTEAYPLRLRLTVVASQPLPSEFRASMEQGQRCRRPSGRGKVMKLAGMPGDKFHGRAPGVVVVADPHAGINESCSGNSVPHSIFFDGVSM